MAEPTAQEQFMLELVNRARSDPEGEAMRFGIDLNEGLPSDTISADAKQPLAFNPALLDSAEGHSAWMLENNSFTEIGENGSTGEERMAAAGYAPFGTFLSAENISQRGNVAPIDATDMILQHHEGIFASVGSRLAILDPEFEEIGIGQALGPFVQNEQVFNASLLTQDLAARTTTGPFLTGVAFDDEDGDDFYSVGEGLDGLTVDAVRQADGAVFSTQTMQSGGYQMALPAGTYTVTVSGGLVDFPSSQITIADENVKYDLEAPSPVFGIILEDDGPTLIETGTFARLIDARGGQQFNVEAGASLDLQASRGLNIFALEMDAANVEIYREAATVILAGPNGESIAFVARSTTQTVTFLDGTLDVRIEGGGVLAGEQTVTETAAPLTSALDTDDTSVGVFSLGQTGTEDLLFG